MTPAERQELADLADRLDRRAKDIGHPEHETWTRAAQGVREVAARLK